MRKVILLLFIILTLLNAGCWSRREVEELAITGAVAFDKVTTEDGRDKYRVAMLIFKPGQMGGGAQQKGGVVSLAPYWILTALGDNLYDAGTNLFTRSPRICFVAHSDVIIIGDRLAREDGISSVMDLILRKREFRLRSYLFFIKGEALKALEAVPELEPTLSQELVRMTEKALPTESKAYVADVKEFANSLLSDGRDAVSGKIEVFPVPEKLPSPAGKQQPENSVRLTGAAVFRGSKLAGWLSDEEAKGLLYVTNKAKGGIIPLKLPGSKQGDFAFEMIRARTKIIPLIQNGNISIRMEVKTEGNVGIVADRAPIDKPEEIKKMEKIVSSEIKRIIQKTVRKSQALETDIFGFGDTVHRKYPRVWKEIRKEWREIYPYLPVEIKVEAKIRGTGMISDPVIAK